MIVLPGTRRLGANADGASASGRTAPMIGFSPETAPTECCAAKRRQGPVRPQHRRHDLRAATSEIRPDWDLSTLGLREAWDAGDYSHFRGWDRRSPQSKPTSYES
jgi:hypothetical protein